MKVLINYGNDRFKKAQKLCSYTAKYAGFDRVIEYSPADIDAEFAEKYNDIFSYKRGAGLWLWKPYIILKTLKELQNGDILFYLDCGGLFIRSAKPIFDILENEPIYVTNIPLPERKFTSRYLFEEFNRTGFEETPQIQAGYIGINRCNQTVEFFEKYLKLCERHGYLDPTVMGIKEADDFVAHREDQSVLSLLYKTYAEKEGWKVHKDPSQIYNIPEKFLYFSGLCEVNHDDTYGVLICLHRSPEAKFTKVVSNLLQCYLPRKVLLALYKVNNRIQRK